MHNQLEEYLNEVAQRLGPLPITRRNDELKEMRQHLLDAVFVNQEFGQSEAEAIENAIAQFGVPQELAQSLIIIWQREERLTKRSLWGAAACTSVILLLQYLIIQVVYYHTAFLHFMRSLGPHGAVIAIPWNISLVILPGLISGMLFRKRAVQGTALAVIVCQAVYAVRILSEHQQLYHLPAFWVITTIESAATVLSAWAASRWWQTRRGRTALSAS